MISEFTVNTDIEFDKLTQHVGPTWDYDKELEEFILPDYSLGPSLILWAMTYLRSPQGTNRDGTTNFIFTPEQARFLCWFYAVGKNGEWIYPKEAYLQRGKGWGKDPFAAAILLMELCAPVKFSHFEITSFGQKIPVGKAWVNPLVQMMAVKHDQNKNTTLNFPLIISPRLKKEYGLIVLNETVKLKAGGLIEIASSAAGGSIQGNTSTFNLFNEIQHFTDASSKKSFEIAQGNVSKRGGRTLGIMNAPSPNEGSIGYEKRLAYEEMKAGRAYDTRIMFDSLEANSKIVDKMTKPDEILTMLKCVYGDSWFANIKQFKEDILNISTPMSYSKRYFFNLADVSEEAWIDIRDWDEGKSDKTIVVTPKQEIIVTLDCSKSNDSTALVGTRVSDGYVFFLGLWAKPPKERGKVSDEWTAPREEVEARIDEVFKKYNVVAFFADPSHAKTDTGLDGSGGQVELYWDGMLDRLHRKYKDKLKLWAKHGEHSVQFDMSSPKNHSEFVDALMKFEDEIYNRNIIHDGNADIRLHMGNAFRADLRDGRHSIWKGDKNSPKKIDLAVTVVLGHMVRTKYLNKQKGKNKSFGSLY